MRKRPAVAFASILTLALSATGQGLLERHIPQSQGEMHARVVALYSFHPSKVSDDERKAKSKEMDVFWDEVKVKPEATLPLLRVELRDLSDPSFFDMDGAQLLLSLSKTKADEALAAEVLPRVDLNDTQSGSYFIWYTAWVAMGSMRRQRRCISSIDLRFGFLSRSTR